jgi:hypothetical protein
MLEDGRTGFASAKLCHLSLALIAVPRQTMDDKQFVARALPLNDRLLALRLTVQVAHGELCQLDVGIYGEYR